MPASYYSPSSSSSNGRSTPSTNSDPIRSNGRRPPSPKGFFNAMAEDAPPLARIPKPLLTLESRKGHPKTRSPVPSPVPSPDSGSSFRAIERLRNTNTATNVSNTSCDPSHLRGAGHVEDPGWNSGSPRPSFSSQLSHSEPARVFGGIEALKRRAAAPIPPPLTRQYSHEIRHIHITAPPSPPLTAVPTAASLSPPSSGQLSTPSTGSPDISSPSGRRSPWLGMFRSKSAAPRKNATLPSSQPSPPIGKTRFLTKKRSIDLLTKFRPASPSPFDPERIIIIRAPSPVSTNGEPLSRTSSYSSESSFLRFSAGEESDNDGATTIESVFIPRSRSKSPGPLNFPPARQSSRSPSPQPQIPMKKTRPAVPPIDIDYHVKTATRRGRHRSYSDPESPMSESMTITTPVRFDSMPSPQVWRDFDFNSRQSSVLLSAPRSAAADDRRGRSVESKRISLAPSIVVDKAAPLHQNPFDNDWDFNCTSPVLPRSATSIYRTAPEVVSRPSHVKALPKSRSPSPSPLSRGAPLRPAPTQPLPDTPPASAITPPANAGLPPVHAGLLGVYKNERRKEGWSGEWSNATNIDDVITKLRKLR
ncbi:hypothetical protein DL96DRAFT_107025 [Flagelloscypha sp. PMI_526]|nr:hypothetical protein DL96DRAFT_107025 [Flagelloscypha sp. PMI_526]